MAVVSITSSVLKNTESIFSSNLQNSSLPPLILILLIIPYLHINQRKFLLNCTRVQSSPYRNKYLGSELEALVPDQYNIHLPRRIIHRLRSSGVMITQDSQSGLPINHTSISMRAVTDLYMSIYYHPGLCTILSYFVRAESSMYTSEYEVVKMEGILKEIRASQHPSVPQALNYQPYFTDLNTRVHLEAVITPSRTAFRWKSHLNNVIAYLQKPSTVILPTYNKKKNMAYSTQIAYCVSKYGYDSGERNITSRHLLKYYMESGVQIEGPLELRTSFRYNDLKPRLYYCLGGSPFWAAIYIKKFTTLIMEALPSTHSFTRYDVRRIRRLSQDQILVTYDYTSFTTSLSELKYFVNHLANAFEGVEMQVLDVREGIVSLDLGEYLREYNEAVNIHGGFSIHRLFSVGPDAPDEIIYQGRGGSLGVGGNIGLSGLCHGLSLAGFDDDPFCDSVVGDDALLKTVIELYSSLVQITNKLGTINPEKFTVITPNQDPSIESFKYLKRPLSLDHDGEVVLGILDDFPNVAQVLSPEGDGIHSASRLTTPELVSTFIVQVGRYLSIQVSRLESLPDMSEVSMESEFVLNVFRMVYDKYDIPCEGHIPGKPFPGGKIKNREVLAHLVAKFIPPVDTLDVFRMDWMDILYASHAMEFISVPHLVAGEIPLPVYPSCQVTYQTTVAGQFLTLLTDMGFCDMKMQTIYVEFSADVLSSVKLYLSGLFTGENKIRPVFDVEFHNIPSWYYTYMLLQEDPDYSIEYTQEGLAEELKSVGLCDSYK